LIVSCIYAGDTYGDVLSGDWLFVQVNDRESVIIDSWVSRVQYNAFCHALGTGMSRHLQVCMN